MTKLDYHFKSGVHVELEGEKDTDLFEELSGLQEIFGDLTCSAKVDGKVVESNNVRFVVRTDDDENKYYELVCMEPGPLQYFKKQFGVKKKPVGKLFPKKLSKEDVDSGNYILGFNGWHKYKSNYNKSEKTEKVTTKTETNKEEVPF